MSLYKPVFLHPITIPSTHAGAGAVLKINTSTNVTLPAGTYYWTEDSAGSSPSFNLALKTALNAAMAGTWTVAFSAAFRLSITYTGASTPTSIDFVDVDVLSSHMLGGNTDPGATTSLTLTSKAWTGLYDTRWMWRPGEYVLDDETIPQTVTVVARSPFDGSATIDNYGEWDQRTLRMEGVRGAFVYTCFGSDSAFYVEAGLAYPVTNNTLEVFWRDARTLASTPGDILYLANGQSDFGGYDWEKLQWSDPEQLGDLTTCVEEITPSPLQYAVTLRLLDTGVAS